MHSRRLGGRLPRGELPGRVSGWGRRLKVSPSPALACSPLFLLCLAGRKARLVLPSGAHASNPPVVPLHPGLNPPWLGQGLLSLASCLHPPSFPFLPLPLHVSSVGSAAARQQLWQQLEGEGAAAVLQLSS
ncbi:hypothetical protein CLOM_g12430 [Closterium sp. NIES-68]|nr:hypothetical protein CLOM_g12430 [Closterium sp. NIES-68]GJP72496.1 hypothetical protein CLOP_g3225 [Closterium sp. NIES-67]